MPIMLLTVVALVSVACNSMPPSPDFTTIGAKPIWHSSSQESESTNEQDSSHMFVMARAVVSTEAAISTAVLYITAHPSPYCQPDSRLNPSDYGACIPHGGTSQAKLLGAYKAYVNGVLVGTGPGRLINATQGVDAIDVMSVLNAGSVNCIGIQGYYNMNYATDVYQPRLYAVLRVGMADGKTFNDVLLSNSTSFHTMDASDVFRPEGSTGAWAGRDGFPHEQLDMRLYPTGWTLPTFNEDPSKWIRAKEQPDFALPLALKIARPLIILQRSTKDVQSYNQNSRVIIDFQLEMQGGVNFTITAPSDGMNVTVSLSEELTTAKDGSTTVLVPMRTGNSFVDTWTLRKGIQVVTQHEYMEFRYAMVEGVQYGLCDNNSMPCLTESNAWVVRSPLSDSLDDQYHDVPALKSSMYPQVELAKFASENASLVAVWNLTRYTLVAVSLDVNTDSNTRQRDLCHTDAFITALGQLSISNEYGLPKATAMDAFQVDSNIWQGTTDFRAALISLAWAHALYSGDLSVVVQRLAVMRLHSFMVFFNKDVGLIQKPAAFMGKGGCKCPQDWNASAGLPPGVYEDLGCTCNDLIDWPSGSRDGYVETTTSIVPNAYISMALDRMADMATWLGNITEAEEYANISNTIKTTARVKLVSGGIFKDGITTSHSSLHANMFAAAAGFVTCDMASSVLSYIQQKGMACSCMGAYWLLEGLYRIARECSGDVGARAADYALDVLTSSDNNSWLHMIAQGATATMEAWTPQEKPNLSFSHPWCSSPANIIVRQLLGVRPLSLGWSTMIIAPQPSSLTNTFATIPTPPGVVTVVVTQTLNTTISLKTSYPNNIEAQLCLPPPNGVTVANKLLLNGKEVTNAVMQGRLLCVKELLAGSGNPTTLQRMA
eukprot:m.115456 g.115456  ORF g.115456 m.115456 type:complete len:887 (-) comp14206_c1_seq1:419-3079(-)